MYIFETKIRRFDEIENHLYAVFNDYRNMLKYRNVGVDVDIWLVEADRAGK